MCGICGFTYHSDAASASGLLAQMTARIVHRGPDDDGQFVSDGVALGMRRLSIIDIDGGKQPVFNEDESIAVVQNGEIYNFQELRTRLEGLGHRFRSRCDTEVIVHLYEQYGTSFVEHLNGMFAIALWDSANRRLMLVRDRLGVKPLYYAIVGDTLVFGSEIKCLLQHPDVSRELDHQAVLDYFTLGYIPAPRSIYRQIRKLPPGSRLVAERGEFTIERYWEVPSSIAPGLSRGEAIQQLRELLDDAVRLRMISDVPLGAFLSGGIDSSIVVAAMAKQSAVPIKTFFIDFDDSRFSERDYARAVAKRYGTDHHELTVRPNALTILDDVIHHFDEPFGDSSAIPTWYVSQLTREHVTVALAGDGGDESFGGYLRYSRILNRRNLAFLRRMIRPLSSATAAMLPRRTPGCRFIRGLGLENSEHFAVATAEFDSRSLLSREFLRSIERPVTEEVHGLVADLKRTHDPLMPFTRFDLNWYLPDDILTKVDRMSMAHSLEVRGPFLDYRLVEFAARMPAEWKLDQRDRKLILKQAFSQDLPDCVLTPRKRGFSIPLADWFRGELRPLLEDVIQDEDLMGSGIMNRREVRGLLDEHVNKIRDRSSQLWRILFFAQWHRSVTAR
jgi:asparagine synthase (glutamine-hydrolysing)